MCPLGYSNECFLKNTHPSLWILMKDIRYRHNEFVFMLSDIVRWHENFLLMCNINVSVLFLFCEKGESVKPPCG